ncbi:hypothetical protein EB061_06030 [bacterium]|nr:hypothetical protein [bacterium]
MGSDVARCPGDQNRILHEPSFITEKLGIMPVFCSNGAMKRHALKRKLPDFLLLSSCSLTLLSSCAGPTTRSGMGLLYMNHHEGDQVTSLRAGRKRGSACVENFLGLVLSGDSTISAAMKAGAITEVSSVDRYYKNYLGFYSKTCTVVTGN